MYKSKRNGRNAIQFYDRHLRQEELNKRQFENEIQEAIQKQEFVLHYQPQVEIKTNRIVKVEALIRWQHPVIGIISPDKFIPYLELSGLIIEVGFWVLEESIKQLGEWIQKGVNDIGMSVNVSAHQFMRADFVENLSILLNKYAIPAHLIELELTESVAVTDIDLTIIRMKMINLLGVKIALDDFGTGYSSLAYLKHFPIDTLKIDKSFISGLPDDGYDAAIVETTMVMSRHLGLKVVAEGVETETQLKFLKAQECQLYQGYLCGRAMPENVIFPILYQTVFENNSYQKIQY
jgi:EAL domain-containing protein (putative c-di-GMP-specific phosphodiesterase class I)